MKKRTKQIRKYPKKWSKERVSFENRKRDHAPRKPKERQKLKSKEDLK